MFKGSFVWVSAFFILLTGSTGFAEESSDHFGDLIPSRETSHSDSHRAQLSGLNWGGIADFIGAFGSHSDDDDYYKSHRRRRGPGRNRGSGLSCHAKDYGWEEHFGGHSSCRSCLRKHGSCVETCKRKTYKCTVKGVDYGYDRERTFRGKARRRRRAERKALNHCYDAGYDNCYSEGCNSRYVTVSRDEC